MNKADLIAAVAAKAGMTQKDTGAVINTFLGEVTGALAKKEKVQIMGFGSFGTRERKEHMVANLRNKGQKIKVAATTVPSFKAGKELKDAVAGK